METMEMITYVKSLNISDKEKANLLKGLIEGSGKQKTTYVPQGVTGSEKNTKAAPTKAAPAKAAPAKAAPAKAASITIIKYSEKAGAVIGDTKPIKESLKALQCRFNAFLKVDGNQVAGWLFSIKRIDEIKSALKVN